MSTDSGLCSSCSGELLFAVLQIWFLQATGCCWCFDWKILFNKVRNLLCSLSQSSSTIRACLKWNRVFFSPLWTSSLCNCTSRDQGFIYCPVRMQNLQEKKWNNWRYLRKQTFLFFSQQTSLIKNYPSLIFHLNTDFNPLSFYVNARNLHMFIERKGETSIH